MYSISTTTTTEATIPIRGEEEISCVPISTLDFALTREEDDLYRIELPEEIVDSHRMDIAKGSLYLSISGAQLVHNIGIGKDDDNQHHQHQHQEDSEGNFIRVDDTTSVIYTVLSPPTSTSEYLGFDDNRDGGDEDRGHRERRYLLRSSKERRLWPGNSSTWVGTESDNDSHSFSTVTIRASSDSNGTTRTRPKQRTLSSNELSTSSSLATTNNLSSRSYGGRKVTVVRILTLDSTPTNSLDDIHNVIIRNKISVRSQFLACSYGKIEWSLSPIHGLVDVLVNETILDKNVTASSLSTLAQIRMREQLSLDYVGDIADVVIFCFPPGTEGTWLASAGRNHWRVHVNNEYCTSLSTLTHEIGHTIGLGHSYFESIEYADKSGYMGYSYPNPDWPLRCYNGFMNFQLGWYNASTTLVDPLRDNKQRKVRLRLTAFTDYDAALASASSLSGMSLVDGDAYDGNGRPDVITLINISDEYFLQYNRAEGMNVNTGTFPDQVTITRPIRSSTGSNNVGVGLQFIGDRYVDNSFTGGFDIRPTNETQPPGGDGFGTGAGSMDSITTTLIVEVCDTIQDWWNGEGGIDAMSIGISTDGSSPCVNDDIDEGTENEEQPEYQPPSSSSPTKRPTTIRPTTVMPTTAQPTSIKPTSATPTTIKPTSEAPTTIRPTSEAPTTIRPNSVRPTTSLPSVAPTSTPVDSGGGGGILCWWLGGELVNCLSPSLSPTGPTHIPSIITTTDSPSVAVPDPTFRPSLPVTTTIATMAPTTTTTTADELEITDGGLTTSRETFYSWLLDVLAGLGMVVS